MRAVIPVILTLLILASCTDEPSGPTPPTTPDTTSHEFVWEVDTLFFRGTTMPVYFQAKAFYGTSASNVYMAGYSTSGITCCWLWDGEQWEAFDIETYGGRDIADISGIDSTFIVFLSFDPGHPNGTRATGVTAYDNGAFWEIPLPLGTRNRTCLHVVSRNEIYLGGVDGIQRFDGTKWEWMLDSTDSIEDSFGHEFWPKYIHKFADGNIEFVSEETRRLILLPHTRWRLENNQFVVKDSFYFGETEPKDIRFGYSIEETDGQVYSSSIGGIFQYRNGNWDKIFDTQAFHITGVSNDFYYANNWGAFKHFNGSTWVDLYDTLLTLVPDLSTVNGVFTRQKNIFIAFSTPTHMGVVHGKQIPHN